MFSKPFSHLILLLSISFISSIEKNETTIEEFIPTEEWQVVKPNQMIPPGLHIRSNFQTGITEAKLLSSEKEVPNSGSNSMILINETVNETDAKSHNYSPKQLKELLKNIKDDSSASTNNPLTDATDSIEINGTRFRSYNKLKEEMASVQMDFKTDLEIIKELLMELQSNVDKNRKVTVLEDIEYYLHQIDNAQNFVEMGGLTLLHEYLEGKDLDLKSGALSCLSSALQGNSKVKVEAIKNGTLTRLLIQLKQSRDASLINKILIAISATTRQFPIAQIAFFNGGGMSIFADVFDHYSTLGNTKISLKIITLISDWLKERNSEGINLSVEEVVERHNQYQKIHINSILYQEGWCARFNRMLSSHNKLSVDYCEKVINSLLNIYPICGDNIARDEFSTFLAHAHQLISQLMNPSSDSEDLYFSDMLKLINDGLSLIKSGTKRNEL